MRVAPPSPRVLAAGLIVAGLTGCDDGGQRRLQAELRAAQVRADPPQLWSAQVVGEAHGGRPVLICADRQVRSGFDSVVPAHEAVHCARVGPVARTPHGQHYRCRLDGATYAVASHVEGDPASDFTAGSSIHALSGEGADYARTLRFRHLGACPAGWQVGATTDQRGRRVDP